MKLDEYKQGELDFGPEHRVFTISESTDFTKGEIRDLLLENQVETCPNCEADMKEGKCYACGNGLGDDFYQENLEKRREKEEKNLLKKYKKKQKKIRKKDRKKPEKITSFSGEELSIFLGNITKYAPKKSIIKNGQGKLYFNIYEKSDSDGQAEEKKIGRFQVKVNFKVANKHSYNGDTDTKVLESFSIGVKMKKMKNGWKQHYFSGEEFENLQKIIHSLLANPHYNPDLKL